MASAVIRGVLVTGTAEELNQLINLATTQVTISGTTTYGKDYGFSAKKKKKLTNKPTSKLNKEES